MIATETTPSLIVLYASTYLLDWTDVVSLIAWVWLVGLLGLVGLVGIVGLVGLMDLVGNHDNQDNRVMEVRLAHMWVDFRVIFTQATFLENKIYTEKRQFFALNL